MVDNIENAIVISLPSKEKLAASVTHNIRVITIN